MVEWPKSNDALGTANRGNAAESGLCTLCTSDCKGKCETWMSSMMGRKLLYPRDFGATTSGARNTTHVGACYNSLRIQGYNYGSQGLKEGLSCDPDDCLFTNVSLEGSFGATEKTTFKLPIMTGALGSTAIASKYWDSFCIGAALSGYPIVVGENVVGIDKEAVIEKGRIKKAPELDRRIQTYQRYFEGYGAIIVQLNVEDTRNGVAEYVVEKYGESVVIELKWGQGAKDIGGEIQVNSLDYALFLKTRGYLLDPDPSCPEAQEAFESGAIKAFARHSRLGGTNLQDEAAVKQDFMESVAYLRKIGFKRISLKTGSYGNEALAMAIKYASEAKLDLLTIDGSGGGTGMSPWNMMETWGMPSLHLHAQAYRYAKILEAQGVKVVDMAFGGGLAREDHIFKALALGAPFTKLICMGRSLMIPAFLGSNIEGALKPEHKEKVFGHWEKLPASVTEKGTRAEEIFAGYYEVQKLVGKVEMANIPYGAIASFTLADKLSTGLQQLLAGARKFNVGNIAREDIFSANAETANITGVPFMLDVDDEKAVAILKG
ncbi:MAG: FMN-binding glutamate synthase family protein [Campylobacterales bacterium]|nr:FMN-binding glutamate synthase family protein [Campylobacterales bacterium]